MSSDKTSLQRIHQEFVRFEKNMEELDLLKRVTVDLKSYRRMIRIKKYD